MSHQVTVQPDGVVLPAEEGTRLVLAIEDGGIDILHRCGGNARCATCRVEVIDGDPGDVTPAEEAKLATVTGHLSSTRLGCQVQVRGPLTVEVVRRLSQNPDMADPGPRPVAWPVDGPLPPE